MTSAHMSLHLETQKYKEVHLIAIDSDFLMLIEDIFSSSALLEPVKTG